MSARDFRELMDEEEGAYDATQDVYSEHYEGNSMYIVGYLVIAIILGVVIGVSFWLWQ